MKHWAKLNNNRIVIDVITADDQFIASGQAGNPFNFLETSKSGEFRKNYAGIGYQYDMMRNAFIAPKPFNSWLLNENTCIWEAPVPYPADGKEYGWDEATLSWVEIVKPEN
jgi:hypothetical protein